MQQEQPNNEEKSTGQHQDTGGRKECKSERTVRMRNIFYKDLQRGQQSPNRNN